MHVRFRGNLNFLHTNSKNAQISNFMKIRLVGTKSFYADGRTDRYDEANSQFSQFCESTYKYCTLPTLMFMHSE